MSYFVRRKPTLAHTSGLSEAVTNFLPKAMADAVNAFMLQSNVGMSKAEALRWLIDRGLRA